MKGEIYSKGKQSPPTKLNTKGCCFFCLQIVDFKADEGQPKTSKSAISLRCLSRHLKIKLPKSSTIASSSQKSTEDAPTAKKKEEMEIDLCQSCEGTVNHFSKAFLSLEKFQMEVNYWMGKIHQQISEGSKKPEIVQNYSKRMTSDPEALAQLVLVDNLRKEISKKSSNGEGKPMEEANVKLFRLKNMEKYFRSSKLNEPVDDEDYISDADNMSAPSPIGTIEEDCKTAIDAVYSTKDSSETHKEKCDWGGKKVQGKKGTKYVLNPETGKYSCVKCKKQFAQSQSAWTHYDSVHLHKKYKCAICNQVFKQLSSFYTHRKTCKDLLPIRLAKQRARETNPKNKYPCKICGKKFLSATAVSIHYNGVHLNKRNYGCDLCHKKFKRQQDLREHKELIHDGRTFFCRFCKKELKFAQKRYFKVHEKRCGKTSSINVKTELIKQ